MKKYAVLLSYRGSHYCGWQKQKGSAADGAPSIQKTIELALQQMTGEELTVVGSGRTDSGVHAAGQIGHFVLRNKVWDPAILQKGLNSILPMSIRALEVKEVEIDFHAQHSAQKKQYSYYFQQGPCAIPHLEPFSWWIHKRLDLEAMQKGLNHLIGEHDFKAFQASGSKPGPTVRQILEAEVSVHPVQFPGNVPMFPGGSEIQFIRVRLIGTGFLKQMVRSIVGTLLQVGELRRDPEVFAELLKTLDRNEVGPTAPARALWLERVWYPEKYGLKN